MEKLGLDCYGATGAQFAAAAEENLSLGRIVRQERLNYTLATGEGEIRLSVTGRFRHAAVNPADYPVAGDWALWSARGIEKLLSRKTFLVRTAAGKDPYPQPIAANMDLCLLCMPLDATYNPSKLERFMAAAQGSGAKSIIVLTKADLCCEAAAACEQTRARFPGTAVIACTALRAHGFAPLRAHIGAGVTAALLGGSGVGKTTLVNALAGVSLATQSVRQDGKGRHTTARRELILLPGGGILIDTPGMRALALEESDVASTFPDIDALAAQCRFGDCAHTNEPGCAVLAALERGELDARRCRSYQKLLAEEARGKR